MTKNLNYIKIRLKTLFLIVQNDRFLKMLKMNVTLMFSERSEVSSNI